MFAAPILSGSVRRTLFIYNLFFPFVFLALLPGYLLRMLRRGNYRENFAQRFGKYSAADRARFASGDWVWLHSISVGETLLTLKIARAIREFAPAQKLVISVTTSTGFAVAKPHACDWLAVIYNPLDAAWIVPRAMEAVGPARLIFIEAIWPNLLAQAKRRGIPVTFLPRLSPRSERRFRRGRAFTGPLFALLDALAVQEPDDVQRWQTLGARLERIHVTGNAKYDQPAGAVKARPELLAALASLGAKSGAPVVLAGSTFPGEEKIIAEVFRTLRSTFPDLFLIIVPRHVERTPAVLAELAPLGLRITSRTAREPVASDVLVVDTTGELREWYALSTVVFIGKSLTATGGQNPVEPVLAGKPVLFGPHMENFAPIVTRWLAADAAIQVQNAAELAAQISRLLADPDLRATLAHRAREIVASHEGATARTAAALLQIAP